METTGQTMGLDETLNGLNATSEENGIDVHMMLPTEYGAVAILSASGYGNSGKLRDEADAQKRTTTGNSTGVYFTGDRWEWMASSSNSARAKYDNSNKNLIGSIMNPNGTVNWHSGASNSTACAQWEYYKGNNPCLMRESNLAGGAGIFSWGVGGSAWVADRTWHEANRWGAKSSWSRGVANMIYKNNS